MNVQEDQGWKLLHGEVFRAPSHPLVLSTMVGTGAQLSAMVAVTLVFALFGFLSPSLRGSLASTMLVFWTLFSCVNGYVSTRIFLSFGGEAVKKLAFLSATLFPTYVLRPRNLTRLCPGLNLFLYRSSIIFAVIFLLNLFLVGAGSSGAIPFGTILAVVVIWFLISVPLTIAGVWFGIRHGALEHPTRVNPIPRQIPPGPTYLKKWPAAALAGLLPWAAAFVELFFVLSSLFGSKAYYAFGFLFLTLCIVILVRPVPCNRLIDGRLMASFRRRRRPSPSFSPVRFIKYRRLQTRAISDLPPSQTSRFALRTTAGTGTPSRLAPARPFGFSSTASSTWPRGSRSTASRASSFTSDTCGCLTHAFSSRRSPLLTISNVRLGCCCVSQTSSSRARLASLRPMSRFASYTVCLASLPRQRWKPIADLPTLLLAPQLPSGSTRRARARHVLAVTASNGCSFYCYEDVVALADLQDRELVVEKVRLGELGLGIGCRTGRGRRHLVSIEVEATTGNRPLGGLCEMCKDNVSVAFGD